MIDLLFTLTHPTRYQHRRNHLTVFSTTETLDFSLQIHLFLSHTPTMAGSENEPANSSSGDEEISSEVSESEPETDKTPESPQLHDPNIKPLTSNLMNDDHSKKPRSKTPTSRYSPPPIKQSTGKRPAAEDEGTDSKRIKKTPTPAPAPAPDADNGGEKKQLFQRLWSEDNEIELIQGMINYVKEKGKDPVADVNDFHEFVKKSLHVDVNDRQMLTKVRRLKKKFKDNVAKVENKGKVRSFSNPHEKKMYEFSKILWGDDSNKSAVMSSSTKKVKVKVNVTPKVNKNHTAVGSGDGNVGIEETPNEVELKVVQPLRSSHGLDHLGSMGLPITDEGIINKGLELASGAKRVEMEEKWKSLKTQELEHFLKKMDVLKEQAEVVLKAIANSGAK
ncbi:hypothetical protein L1987_28408 [Smallanthus sonchifolius]|uniref:Uncharacterized protein n=1 Tax=Smallanthus sonchifolius TaxID=185202 RepID=A0ACB9HYK7_9ASTR|nr:hypothetical protein L1987_28408 [Smallanthus sonchifolius]